MTDGSNASRQRRQLFHDLQEASCEIRQTRGSQTASIRRLVSSDSPGLGLPPTDAYASGLVDLSVCASSMPSGLCEGAVASITNASSRFEFWNIEVFLGDEILFQGDIYDVRQVEDVTPGVLLGSVEIQSGVVVLKASDAPEEPVGAMCIVGTKPAAGVSFKLEYVDDDDEVKVSDAIEFAASCKVGDSIVVTTDGLEATVASLEDIVDFEGDLGGGILRIYDNCPFRTRVLGERRAC